jgi:signal transduction histidine kinase
MGCYACGTGLLFGTTAVLLASRDGGTRSGVVLGLAAWSWCLSWLCSYDRGPYPLVGEGTRNLFYLFGAVGVLTYPHGRFRTPAERRWGQLMVATQLIGVVQKYVTQSAGALHYGPRTLWPVAPEVFGSPGAVLECGIGLGKCACALWLSALLVRRLWAGHRLARCGVAPLTALTVLGGAMAAAAELHSLRLLFPDPAHQLADRLQTWFWATSPYALVPAGILVLEAHRCWAAAAAAQRVINLTATTKVETVRQALRQALADPALEIAMWVAAHHQYLLPDGRALVPGHAREPDAPGWFRHLQDHDGSRLALVRLSPELRPHRSVVDAALSAAQRSLCLAQTQARLIVQEREVERQVARAQDRQQQQIRRDLHDGAQQGLLAVCVRLGALEADQTEGPLQERIRGCRLSLLDALGDLRTLARGGRPAALADDGIAAAIAATAERLGVRPTLCLPPERLPADLEAAVYFGLCEAMTNAVRHSGASQIEVTLQTRQGWLVGTVRDDGVGDVVLRPGGGLSGLADRLQALGGRLTVSPGDGRGTCVRVEVPCRS